MEYWQEIVEIVLDGCWNMPLNNPMQRLGPGKEVENVRCHLCPKDKHTEEEELTLPMASLEMPVLRLDWDMMVSILEIKLH